MNLKNEKKGVSRWCRVYRKAYIRIREYERMGEKQGESIRVERNSKKKDHEKITIICKE